MECIERPRAWYEPEGWPDPNCECPICKKECKTVFLFYGDEVGCDLEIRAMREDECGEYSLSDTYCEYRCPVCGERAETLYANRETGEIEGCDECVEQVDSDEYNEWRDAR